MGDHDQEIHPQVGNNSSSEDAQSKNENITRVISRRKRELPNNGSITTLLDDMLHEDHYDRRRRPDNKGAS